MTDILSDTEYRPDWRSLPDRWWVATGRSAARWGRKSSWLAPSAMAGSTTVGRIHVITEGWQLILVKFPHLDR